MSDRVKFYSPAKKPSTADEHEACTKHLNNVICRAYEGYFCTRKMNHPGDHIAASGLGTSDLGQVLVRWHNEEG